MTRPGIHQITMPEYLSLKALSSGLIHTLLTCSPFHARHEQDHREDDSNDVSDIGTAIHDSLLEGLDRICIVDADSWRTKAAKEQRIAARENHLIPLLAHKVPQVQGAVEAVRDFLASPGCEIRDCFSVGQPEVTGVWDDGGTLCKLRADWLSNNWHISVKTTDGSANPSGWIRRQLGPMDYDVSLCFYDRGLLSLGRQVESRLLVIEQNAPYGCSVVGLAPSRLEYASARLLRGIELWKSCAASDRWPAYSPATHFAETVPWEQAAEEEVQLGGAYDALVAGEL